MGTFTVSIRIGDLQRRNVVELDALVDTGATTTVVPASVLEGLGVAPTTRRTFVYADGSQAELDMAQVWVNVEGRETITWVIFGGQEAGPLLGSYSLEGTFLGVDPYNQRLIPIDGLLM